jgi:flagellar basal-body rod modification protein FlgD
MTTPVQQSAAAGTAATAAEASGGLLPANQTIDKQEFLTLFLAQLKNQDPLSPLQPDQLTAQLAQFSSLEQLTAINTRLETLTDGTKQTTTAALLSMIGRQVGFDGSRLGVKNGQAPEVRYTLDTRAAQVTATVRNENGQVVRTVDLGDQGAGEHGFRFDGRNGNGAVVPDGTYRVEISVKGTGAEAPRTLPLVATAPVEGVDLGGDAPALLVNGRRVGLDEVHEVRAADQ